ncbi:hypothetical protein FACS1894202_01550 [Clostridia bacterium]|nr:hypothetical protein FACS1894202_01550 [Clostridia bacterium]
MPKTKTRLSFPFGHEAAERRESYERLAQVICSAHWGSGIDIFGFMDDRHLLLFEFIEKGVIVIDECEYEVAEPCEDSKAARLLVSLLGKRKSHSVMRHMATLFGDEPFETAGYYRNTLYLPGLKAYARADGIKPEVIAEMLAGEDCDRIILFPYFPLDSKTAYYELTLAVDKSQFADVLRKIEQRKSDAMYDELMRIEEQNKLGNRVTLRLEKKSDYETVEQITYRAFLNAEHAGGDEALLARKLRTCSAFVPELDFVAELDGKVIGNIMYTRSKIIGEDDREWCPITFGPVSVLPKYQRQGVGSALIRKSLDVARELGYGIVIIYGHESYYPRFGFKPCAEYGITTADGENFPAFMALPLTAGALDGVCGRFILDEVYTNLDKAESDALNAKLAAPMDVDEYIDAQPLYFQQFLKRVRGVIKAATPGATEKISYQMPTFRDGRNLIHFAAFKRHIGVYPGAEAMEHFAPRLYRYKTSKGAIQFPYESFGDEQLTLIGEIAAWTATNK